MRVTARPIKLPRKQSCITRIDPIMPDVHVSTWRSPARPVARLLVRTNYGAALRAHVNAIAFCGATRDRNVHMKSIVFQALRYATAMQLTEVVSVPSGGDDGSRKSSANEDEFGKEPSGLYQPRNTRENPAFLDRDEVWRRRRTELSEERRSHGDVNLVSECSKGRYGCWTVSTGSKEQLHP